MRSITEEMYLAYLSDHKRAVKQPDIEFELYDKVKAILDDKGKALFDEYAEAFEDRSYEDCLAAYRLAFSTGLLLGMEINCTGGHKNDT